MCNLDLLLGPCRTASLGAIADHNDYQSKRAHELDEDHDGQEHYLLNIGFQIV